MCRLSSCRRKRQSLVPLLAAPMARPLGRELHCHLIADVRTGYGASGLWGGRQHCELPGLLVSSSYPLGGITAAIGGDLFVSALTDSCTMARVLGLPYNQSMTCDVYSIIAGLGSRRVTESDPARPSPSGFPRRGDVFQ